MASLSRLAFEGITLRYFAFCLVLMWALAVPSMGAEPVEVTQPKFSADDLAYFTQVVEPVLVQHCYGCHGNGKDKGGLNLYTYAGLTQGGETGPAIDFANVPGSLLIEAINYTGYEMPPSGKLPQERIDNALAGA